MIKSLERISSGNRINHATDDTAGLSIFMKLKAQFLGLEQAQRNAQDAVALIQTAEGALNETHSLLQRMRELAVLAAGDMLSISEREAIQKEISQLNYEINRISTDTEFNKKKLLNGTYASETNFVAQQTVPGQGGSTPPGQGGGTPPGQGGGTPPGQGGGTPPGQGGGTPPGQGGGTPPGQGGGTPPGQGGGTPEQGSPPGTQNPEPNQEQQPSPMLPIPGSENPPQNKVSLSLRFQIGVHSGHTLTLHIEDMSTQSLYNGKQMDMTTRNGAEEAITILSTAIDKVSAERSRLGTVQNRLEIATSSLEMGSLTTSLAQSRIRDSDIAKEMMTYTKSQLLTQTTKSLISQANQQSQRALKLLFH